MKKTFYLLVVCLLFFSCVQKNNNSYLQSLPTFIHEGDSVIVNVIKDSISINTDSLFFHIDVYYQDFSYTKGYIKIKNGEGRFKVPKNAAYISGFFYNLIEGSDTKKYKKLVYDATNKPVLNAYQRENSKKGIENELFNHPNNTAIYASHVQKIAEDAYLGKVNDSLLKNTANRYLSLVVEGKKQFTNVYDLYTLTILYANTNQIEQSKQTLLKLARNYPNSFLFHKAKSHLWFTVKNLKSKNEQQQFSFNNSFFDSLKISFSKEFPYSPESRWNSYFQIINEDQKHFSNEVVTQNLHYKYNYIDSTDINTIYFLYLLKIGNNELDSAYILAEKQLSLVKKDILRHYSIAGDRKSGRISNKKGNYLSIAYDSFREINEQKANYQSALAYLDSARIAVEENEKYPFYNPNEATRVYYNHKARLQRKAQQPFEALKTYSKLYQEVQDEQILDSIKVVFEEQDQVEGFDAYVENLKNQTEGKEEELKTVSEFSIKDTEGNLYTDKNLKGAVVVLNFWGTHCSPCIREIPVMNEFWEATQGHEIVYLAITRDKALATERFGRRQKEMFEFPVVATNQEFFDTFDVQLIPTQIIINPKGEIIYTQVGATPNATQNLKKILEEELQIDNILIE